MHISFAVQEKGFFELNPLVAGHEACEKGHRFGPSIREYYILHYVVSGKGVLESRGRSYPVKVGEVFLICPHEVTTYFADAQQPWEYIWIGFSGKLASRFSEIQEPVFSYEADTFLKILQAPEMGACLEEFLAGKLFEIYANTFQEKKSADYVVIVKNYIQNNYMKQIKISDLSRLVGLDKRYLSRIFKARVGDTMQQYLISHRMERARQLLQQGYDVKTTTLMVGYEDSFVFSKAFKRTYGFSPIVAKLKRD